MPQKTINILLFILLAFVVIGILYLIFKPADTTAPPQAPPATPPSGFGKGFADILSQIPNIWKSLFGNKPSNYSQTMCDPEKIGYNKNGVLDPSCGGGAGSCNPFLCDENRPGYTQCGDKGFPCD